jgi:hypothetical protein
MDDQMTAEAYETPRVVDYGDLQTLTADCYGATGGDAAYPGAGTSGFIGASNPAGGCKSTSTP